MKKSNDSVHHHKPRSRHRERGFFDFETKNETKSKKAVSKMVQSNSSYPYKAAKFTFSKIRSFVAYYYYCADLGKLKRRVEHCPAAISSMSEIEFWGQQTVREINQKLKAGYVFGTPTVADTMLTELQSKSTLISALFFTVREKSKLFRKKSLQTYESEIRGLDAYFKAQKVSEPKVHSFGVDDAKKYRFFLLNKERTPNGINQTFARLKTLFNGLIDAKIIIENPFAKIKPLAETESYSNVAITPTDQHTILTHFDVMDVDMYFFLHFVYHGFIRPKELLGLKIKHVGLERITIPGSVSKNRKTETVAVNPKLRTIIEEMCMDEHDPECFLFGKNLRMCKTPCPINHPGNLHRAAIAELDLNRSYTLYSWKHSGAIAALQVLKNAKKVSLLLRHSNISTTDIYFKSLGMTIFEETNNVSW